MVKKVDHDLKDIARRLSSGETMVSIATSKGIKHSSLSLWIKNKCKRDGLIRKVTPAKIEFIPIKNKAK
jgi:hypothetical protein